MGHAEIGPERRRWLPLDGEHGLVRLDTPIDEMRIAVDDSVELGQVAGLVEVGEPVEGGEGAGFVGGEVETVQFAEGVPGGPQAGCVSKSASSWARSVFPRRSGRRSSTNRARNTSGSNTGVVPSGWRRWMSRRTAVSPAANQPMTWKR